LDRPAPMAIALRRLRTHRRHKHVRPTCGRSTASLLRQAKDRRLLREEGQKFRPVGVIRRSPKIVQRVGIHSPDEDASDLLSGSRHRHVPIDLESEDPCLGGILGQVLRADAKPGPTRRSRRPKRRSPPAGSRTKIDRMRSRPVPVRITARTGPASWSASGSNGAGAAIRPTNGSPPAVMSFVSRTCTVQPNLVMGSTLARHSRIDVASGGKRNSRCSAGQSLSMEATSVYESRDARARGCARTVRPRRSLSRARHAPRAMLLRRAS
jgi:hypothetical protein